MGWIEASAILFGGLVAIMGLGLPVAFAFLALNILGAWLFLGGEPGLTQLARNAVQSVTIVFADADPVLRADGRGAVPDRSRHEGDRRVRGTDPPRAGAAFGDRDRRRHRVLGDLRIDHRHHRPARLADAADHAGARLRAEDGDGPDHGHRRGRHADPALCAHRAARLHRRHLDFGAADRRHRAGTDPQCAVRRLHHHARRHRSIAGAERRIAACARSLGALAAVHRLRAAAGGDLRGRRRRDDRRLRDADRSRRARRRRHHAGGDLLPRAHGAEPDEGADRHRGGVGHDPVHHPRRDDLFSRC